MCLRACVLMEIVVKLKNIEGNKQTDTQKISKRKTKGERKRSEQAGVKKLVALRL